MDNLRLREKELKEKICGWYYSVSLSYLTSRTEDDIRMNGTHMSGIKEVDDDIHNKTITTQLPISVLIKKYELGATIKVFSTDEAQDIYTTINDFIHVWKDILDTSINTSNVPFIDLITLDKFAHEIYENCSQEFKDTNRPLYNSPGFRPTNLLRNPNANNNKSAIKPKVDRIGLSEYFENRSVYNRRI